MLESFSSFVKNTRTQIQEELIENKKEEYTKFFKDKLTKYNVTSPAELSDEEKSKFFTEIEKEWNKDE